MTFYSDAGGLGGICKTKVNYMPKGTVPLVYQSTSGRISGHISGYKMYFRSESHGVLDHGLPAKSNFGRD